MADYKDIDALIDKALTRDDLTGEDILNLTIARRLNKCSDNTLAEALGGAPKPPLNMWGKR